MGITDEDEAFLNGGYCGGVPGFDDTFFGPDDKDYMDFNALDMNRLRGIDLLYFPKLDQTRRIDGFAPLQTPDSVDPVLGLKKRSGDLIGRMYGEPARIKERIDGTKRVVELDWNYGDAVKVRGIVQTPSSDEDPDERGTIYSRETKLWLPRKVMERIGIRPRQGDVVQLNPLWDKYHDVGDVSRDDTRFGGTGFHVSFELTLEKNSKFVPQRKVLPEGPGKLKL